MPLTLTPGVLNHVPPRPPLRDQLAAHIRQAIATGDLQPGERLPSEPTIANLTGVNRSTVRFALSLLTNEGLINRSRGNPTTVAEPPPVRVLNTQRYRDTLTRLWSGIREDTAAFVTDHGAAWDDYTIDDPDYSEEPASNADAEYLGIKVGAEVMRRRMVKRLKGEPIQIQRSAVPLKFAKGTVLANPAVQPYPDGTLGELYDAGLLPAGSMVNVAEEAHGRVPNTTERRLLGMVVPADVWDIVRVITVDGVPVEVSRVIVSQASHVLRYETDIS